MQPKPGHTARPRPSEPDHCVHVVAARLGHADPAVTLRVYFHVLREHAAGVGDIFAQAVIKATKGRR